MCRIIFVRCERLAILNTRWVEADRLREVQVRWSTYQVSAFPSEHAQSFWKEYIVTRHLTRGDRLWASSGNLGLPTFDTPTGRIGLVTGYDVLFPETLRVLAGKGADLVCAPAYLNFPQPIGLDPSSIKYSQPLAPDEYDPTHSLIWRVRAAEHNVYLALANWTGASKGLCANGNSGIYSPA